MNGYLLFARMKLDDLPIQLFANKKEMGEWLRAGEDTFEAAIDKVARVLDVPTSELLRVEAIRFRNGRPVQLVHVMGFEHIE
jgi:hypothetical protein